MPNPIPKNYAAMLQRYFDRYTESYCKEHNLFIKYDKNKNPVALTRKIVDYVDEIVETDYNLIVGTGFSIRSQNKDLEKLLNDYINTKEFQNMFRLFILQGLVTGDSFIKFGIDDDGNPVLTTIRLDSVTIMYDNDFDKIVKWYLHYTGIKADGTAVAVEEEYSLDRIKITIDGEVIKDVPNQFGRMWVVHAINLPSLRYKFFGESELEKAYETVDEMNSTFSRIASIETVYAIPKLIMSGLKSKDSLSENDNVWAVSENTEIKILEYQGDVIPSMLNKIKALEEYFRSRFPELVLSNVKESTGYALKLKLLKLIKKIEAYRRNYFGALGEALKLVAMHLGYEDDFEIVPTDIIPMDAQEEIQRYLMMYNLGIVSRQTIAEELGLDWVRERERLEEEGDFRFAMPNYEFKGKPGNPGKPEVREGEDMNGV